MHKQKPAFFSAAMLLILIALIPFTACSSAAQTDRLHYSASPAALDSMVYLIDLKTEKTGYQLLLLTQKIPGAAEIFFAADSTQGKDAANITLFENDKKTEARIPDGHSISFARALLRGSNGVFTIAPPERQEKAKLYPSSAGVFTLDTAPLSAELFAKSRTLRQEKAKLYQYSVSWPEFATSDKALNTAINAAGASLAQGKALTEFLEAAKARSESDLPAYEFEIVYTITRFDQDFASVLFQGSEYTGGAHPNHWMKSIIFAIGGEKGTRQLSRNDMFRPDKQDELITLISGKLREQGASWPDEITLESAACTITPGGVHFWFGPYEASPYADGFYDVPFTWDEIAPYLVPGC
ncbi:MAG: DUF3298 and DUF4163 domain-containing protein [Spirochaetota bacterium]|jgi:hypothetical protein|nr:DUF3298 and DUF4163 domain-containing protein [Spirochaetota bacterium]